jgi:hypothetical protein
MSAARLEVADIFNRYGEAYRHVQPIRWAPCSAG